MPYIKVNINKINGFGNVTSQTRSKVNHIQSSFYSTGSALDWDIKACASINSQISKINNELSKEIASLKRMESFFALAAKKYSNAELEKKAPHVSKGKNVIYTRLVPGSALNDMRKYQILNLFNKTIKPSKNISIDKKDSNEFVNLLKKIIKKAGFAGSIYSIIDGEYNTIDKINNKDYTAALSTFAGVFKGTYKTIPKIFDKYYKLKKAAPLLTPAAKLKNWAKSIFGFDSFIKAPSKANKLTTRWYNNYKKIEVKQLGSIGVIDVAVSGVVSIINNVSEYRNGEITAARAVVETISETAIDVVTDAALYTVIGAGAVTIAGAIAGAPVAVPAIAVAGLVVLAKWGLDKMANHFTDGKKDFAEWVSDGLLDLGEKIGNAAVSAYHTVAPKVKDACSTVLNSIKDSANNIIGNIKISIGNIFCKRLFA